MADLRDEWDDLSGGCVRILRYAMSQGWEDVAYSHARFIAGDLWRVFWRCQRHRGN